jgi:hypothetical protein
VAMNEGLRKLVLTAHVTTSVGWLGAVAVFLAHAIAALVSKDDQVVSAVSIAMGLTAWLVLLPLSIGSLVTGLIQALGTAWGLFRHYWIVFKLVLTTLATLILILKLAPIQYLADAGAVSTFSSSDLVGLRTSLVVHAAGGLIVLLVVVTLALYKPRGLTSYGRRKGGQAVGVDSHQARKAQSAVPTWVKLSSLIVVGLFLMLIVMLLAGSHGPGTHVLS